MQCLHDVRGQRALQRQGRDVHLRRRLDRRALQHANDDHGDPWREDYSVALGAGFNLGSGVDSELEQQSLVRLKMQQRGNSCQLTLANTAGRCTLKGVELEAIAGDRTMGTKYSG